MTLSSIRFPSALASLLLLALPAHAQDEELRSVKNDPPPLPAGVYESSQVDVPPKARSQPRPNYPGELKRKRIEGEVLVLFTVEADGHVKDPVVLKATEVRFAKAATDGVLKWRYKPGLLGGAKVACRVQVPIVFELGN